MTRWRAHHSTNALNWRPFSIRTFQFIFHNESERGFARNRGISGWVSPCPFWSLLPRREEPLLFDCPRKSPFDDKLSSRELKISIVESDRFVIDLECCAIISSRLNWWKSAPNCRFLVFNGRRCPNRWVRSRFDPFSLKSLGRREREIKNY